MISKVIQTYPNESFILESESNFNQLIDNTPRALESLKAAFDLNKKSPYLASRLANYYQENDNLDDALTVLHESVNNNLNDRDLNFKYAKLLMIKTPENYVDLKHYLRKSFTKKDKRYEAQFLYARILYLLGEEENKEYFDFLKGVPLDYRIKKQVQGTVIEHGNPKTFEGSVMKLESSYGFIKQDVTGETIYFNRGTDLQELRYNSRIKFKKAFNFNGPIAIEILSQ